MLAGPLSELFPNLGPIEVAEQQRRIELGTPTAATQLHLGMSLSWLPQSGRARPRVRS